METQLTPKMILSSLEDMQIQLSRTRELRTGMVEELVESLDMLSRAVKHNDELWDTVSRAYNRVLALNQHADDAQNAACLALEFSVELDQMFTELAIEHNALYQAVEDGDEDHPLVGGLIESVEEGIYEWQGLVEDDNIQEALWEQRQEYRVRLKELTGLKEPVNHFFNILDGMNGFTAKQLDMMIKLLETFEDEDGDDNED